MITIPITINAGRPCERIALGRRGENEATQIVFDVSWLIDTFGAGTAQLAVIRPEDDTPYPAFVEQDADARTATWTLTNADTANAGRGECELFWYVGDTLAKSIVYRTEVMRDIGDVGEEVPEAYETWVEEVLAAGAQAQENADFLRNASATAVTLSAGSNATASVDDGVFTFGIPRGDKGETGAGAVMFAVEPSATSIVYDPNAEEGARLNHTTLTLKAYKITGNTKAAYAPGYFSISWDSPGSVGGETYNNVPRATSHTFTLPSTLDASCILTAEISANITDSLAKITIPIVSSGLNGAQGPQGDTGAKGDTGATGATPDFSVGTVTTLEPGASATATITGTAESPVLNLGIPKGAKGDTGEVSQAEFDDLAGDVDDLKSQIDYGSVTADLKAALLHLAQKVAYIDDQGQTYYDDLYDALYNRYWQVTNTLSHCSSSNGAEQTIKGNPYTATITASAGYTLTGATVSIAMGGTDITASAYSNGVISIPAVTGALVITVTAVVITPSSITATFTQGENTVWSDDSLDSLKQYLVVTATYPDTSTETIPSTDYTLSGSLSTASSTITVTYQGLTDTFTVTVTVVGSTNYASSNMSNLTRTTQSGATGITDGVLWMKCLNASQISGYNIWAFDCKPTLFSALKDKRVRVRIRVNSPDWSGDLADNNRTRFWITIYQNANVTSGSYRQDNIALGDIAPTSEYQTYEYTTTVSSSASSITSASTVGLCVYHLSLHTVQIASIEIVEILS